MESRRSFDCIGAKPGATTDAATASETARIRRSDMVRLPFRRVVDTDSVLRPSRLARALRPRANALVRSGARLRKPAARLFAARVSPSAASGFVIAPFLLRSPANAPDAKRRPVPPETPLRLAGNDPSRSRLPSPRATRRPLSISTSEPAAGRRSARVGCPGRGIERRYRNLERRIRHRRPNRRPRSPGILSAPGEITSAPSGFRAWRGPCRRTNPPASRSRRP